MRAWAAAIVGRGASSMDARRLRRPHLAAPNRRGARLYRLPLRVVQPVRVLHLQGHARVARQPLGVAQQEVPVQRGEGAGPVADALGRVVAAALAMRAHALDVFAGGDIGLAAHQAAVGVLAHAQGVGQFHPLDRIHVHREIPGVHLAGLHAQHQRIQAGDHQALDVIGVAVIKRLPQRITQAGHVGRAGPVPAGQRVLGIQRIALGIARHAGPVDAADVFTPAQDLADEALDAGQRCQPVPVGGLGRRHHLTRAEQLQVEGRRQVRVVEPRVAGPHCVLVAAEQRQPLAHKGLQRLQGLCPRDRPGKAVQAAGVLRKAGLHQSNHFARDRVGLEADPRRHVAWARSAEGLSVVGIEVPLPAVGLGVRALTLHQHPMPLALLAVEVLHAQGLPAPGVRGELSHRDEEMPILADVQRQAGRLCLGLDGLQDPPVARRGHHEAGRPEARDVEPQLRVQAPGSARRVQPGVVQAAPGRLQLDREVTHRRQEQGRARLAGPDLGRLLGNLGHPDRIHGRIKTVERRSVQVQLVSQHQHEGTQFSHLRPPRCRAG
mmetsp:Transcript_50960/g.119506  ORF Transcript_50960/g.119506 Transcript_50960/m.119506 type:complete len:550 (-) Transcript_50960:44-1693(-)